MRRLRRRFTVTTAALALAAALGPAAPALAHESRPAYLEIREAAPGRFDVLWRTPVLSGARLPVALKLPDGVRDAREPITQQLADSILERRAIATGPEGLTGRRIEFPGLQLTITDVLVRVEMQDGRRWTEIARPARPWIEFGAAQTRWGVARNYLVLGIWHILLGADHLLFVLGLLLIVDGRWKLLKTVTAFTLAHSLTLAAATLGYAELPAPPIEAAIALSILFLGPEIVRRWRGESSFTLRHPWVVAFAFGLLHGFGFAGALISVGLPQGELPLALVCFNLGVELGQLGFIAALFSVERAFQALGVQPPRWVRLLPGYAVGSLGAFWTLQRLAPILASVR